MREFTDKELYLGLEHARNLDEHAGRAILQAFQNEQPVLAQTLLAVFPAVIAEQDRKMAHLYMDLVFDIVCTFRHAAGALPTQKVMGLAWLQEKAALVDAEMTAMMSGKPHSDSVFQINDQQGLVNFMNACIDEHMSDHHTSAEAIRLAKTMIFVTVQLICSMYDQANASKTIH